MIPSRRPEPPERLGSATRKIGTLEHFRWLKGVIWTMLVLNVIDGALTLIWVSTGRATEANPLLAILAHEYPVLFVLVKFTLVGMGSYLLWRYRKHPGSVVGIFVAFLAYYFVLLYHLRSMGLRLSELFIG